MVAVQETAKGANSADGEDSWEPMVNFTGSTFHLTFLNETLHLNVQNCECAIKIGIALALLHAKVHRKSAPSHF